MKISDAVFQTLMGDGIVTHRDEKGLYAEYDRLELEIGGREVRFYKGKTLITSETLLNSMIPNTTLSVAMLEGRVRISMNSTS